MAVDFDMSTQKERFDISVRTEDADSNYVYKSYVVYAESDASKPYEPFINHIMIDATSVPTGEHAKFFKPFDKTVFEHSATNDGTTPHLFATSDDEAVYIEVYNEELDDYAIIDSLAAYIAETIGEENVATFTFRATKFAESGYELVNDYKVTVYNSDSPVLMKLWTEGTGVEMKETFDPTVKNYNVVIGKDVESMTVLTQHSYENATVSMQLDDGAFVAGTETDGTISREFTKLSLDKTEFKITVKLTVTRPNGSIEDGLYVLNVTRSDENVNQVYLADIELADETDAEDGLYEMTPEFAKTTQKYDAKINYVDNTITLTVTAENIETDKLTAKLSDGTIVDLSSGVAKEIKLPVSFFKTDNATEVVSIIVTRTVDSLVKKGTYELTITRDDREEGTSRLASLTTDKVDMTGDFNPEIFNYTINISPYEEELKVTAVAQIPTDSIVFTYNGVDSAVNVGTNEDNFELAVADKESYIFVRVYDDADPETTKQTYVIKVVRANNAFISKIEVIDTVEGDGYEELDPKFNANTSEYEVIIDPLDTDIEFSISTTAVNPTLTMYLDGVEITSSTSDGTSITFSTAKEFENLPLNQKEFKFEFKVESQVSDTVKKAGTYLVWVRRDADGDAKLQTWVTGKVVSVAQNDHSATMTMYD